MTDYLELLLAELEAQEEPGTVLRLPRRRRAAGQSNEIDPPQERTAPEIKSAGDTDKLPPEEGKGVLPEERQAAQDVLYREMTRARETLRRREQAAGRSEERETRRDQGAAASGTGRDAWETMPEAQSRARYAALIDAEFQRDARRYDGALGLL